MVGEVMVGISPYNTVPDCPIPTGMKSDYGNTSERLAANLTIYLKKHVRGEVFCNFNPINLSFNYRVYFDNTAVYAEQSISVYDMERGRDNPEAFMRTILSQVKIILEKQFFKED